MDKKLAIFSVILGSALIAYGFGTINAYMRFVFLFVGFMLIALTYIFFEKK